MKTEIVEEMKTVIVEGRCHVVISRNRVSNAYPDPNYENTRMGLCGVLAKGQSLESFKTKWINKKVN